MSGLDSQPDTRDPRTDGAPESPESHPDGVAILSGIADRELAAGSQPVESGVDGKGSSGGFSVPERHRVVPPPESEGRRDSGAAESPGSHPDGVAILSGIADRELAAGSQPVESGVDGKGSSGGFSVPERHRVVPPPDSGNTPDRGDSLDDLAYGQGGNIPPEMVPEGLFVLRATSLVDAPRDQLPAPPADPVAPGPEMPVPAAPDGAGSVRSPRDGDAGDPVSDGSDGESAGIQPGPGGATDVTPLEPLVEPITETSEPADVRHFLSDQAARRAEGFAKQGQNDLGYGGTCGLASSAEMLSDLTGEKRSENDLVLRAADRGLCVTDSWEPNELGGTTLETLQVLQSEAGVHSVMLRDCDLDGLADFVDSGYGVVAAVKAAEYWPPVGIYESERARLVALAQRGVDHDVWVTGVSRNPDTGAGTGFFVNDTGRRDGAGLFLSNAEMRRAWEQRGGDVLVATRGTA